MNSIRNGQRNGFYFGIVWINNIDGKTFQKMNVVHDVWKEATRANLLRFGVLNDEMLESTHSFIFQIFRFISSSNLFFDTNWWIIHLYSIIIYQTDSWFLKLRNRAKEKKIEFFNRMKTSVFVVKSEIKIKKQTVRLCLLKLFERLLLESQECRRIYSLKK